MDVDVDSYDDLPYPDLCHSWTHPSRLAAIATLSGMRPAPPGRCRVLELGCAGGGNLVPMADGLPGSTFVGVDRSGRQVDAARSFAERAGVHNVRFEQLDLMDLPSDLGRFDYVIAHGVYSWVPADVRDRLMAICCEHLAPMGLAYISYNTLPGWYPGLAVREMLLHRTRHLTDPAERAREAVRFAAELKTIVTLPDVNMPIAELDGVIELGRDEYGGVPAWADSVLLHDQMSVVNEPVYFHQFVAHAGRHALQVVGEVGERWRPPGAGLPADAVALLRELTSDRLELEQYTDFALSRTFRRSLLCHADVALQAEPRPENIAELQLIRLRSDAVATADPLAVAALEVLAEVAPQAVHFDDLLAAVCRRTETSEPEVAGTLATAVLDAADRRRRPGRRLVAVVRLVADGTAGGQSGGARPDQTLDDGRQPPPHRGAVGRAAARLAAAPRRTPWARRAGR